MHAKRILMISYHTCPLASEEGKESGGMNVYVLELSKQLARMGHTVDVITRFQDTRERKIVQVEKNFRVIHLDAGPAAAVHKKKLLTYIPEFVESFRKFAHAERQSYDVVHAHYYQSGIIAMEMKKAVPDMPPLVITFHTLALMKNLVARSAAEQESQARVEAEMDLTDTADAVIAPSASDKLYLTYLYGAQVRKIHEIPPGVNTVLFRPMDKTKAKHRLSIDPKKKMILFVGRIEPLKGIDVLLYALRILISRKPELPVCLMIVGGDISQHIRQWSTPLRQLEQLSHTLGITPNVHFAGQQHQAELAYYYNAADVVVMPSHYESFGMAAAEAMSCGVPVITTNVAGISDLIDEKRKSLITTVNNPLLLASQLERLLTDEKTYGQARKVIQQNVLDLKWETIAAKIDRVYGSVIIGRQERTIQTRI